ncbi:hypothetical protein D1872_270100 [compost metagenome]
MKENERETTMTEENGIRGNLFVIKTSGKYGDEEVCLFRNEYMGEEEFHELIEKYWNEVGNNDTENGMVFVARKLVYNHGFQWIRRKVEFEVKFTKNREGR